MCVPFFVHADTPWFDTDWQYRNKITTVPAQTVGTTTGYIVYVDLADLPASFFDGVDPDGNDLVVTAGDGVTKLKRDLVLLNATSSTGELHVKLPQISSATGTELYLYYGNPSATEVNESGAVWQDYRAVWHLGEEASATTEYGTAIVTQQAMDGGDGSWAVLYGVSPTDSNIDLAVDEDQISDSERNHTTEEVAYFGISGSGTTDIRNSGNVIVGETGVVSSVGAASTTVTFNNSYIDPVVVATYNIASSGSRPAVTRVVDVTGSDFSLYIQNPSGAAVTAGDVHYVVFESGLHTLPGGAQVEAGLASISGVNRSGNWNNNQMQRVIPTGVFNDPVVFGQVMGDNDADWQAFWTSNGTQTGPPTASAIYVGRHVGADSDIARAVETVGYFIVDPGMGNSNGNDWVAGLTTDTVQGVTDGAPFSFTYSGGGASAVQSNIFKDSTVNGFNGGLAGGISTAQASKVGLGVDSDGGASSYIPFDGIQYNSTNGLQELTASFWINTTQNTRSGILDFDRSEHWQVGLNFHNASGQNGQISFDTANSANGIRDLNSGVTINDGSWHYVTAVYDNNATNDKSIYIDGVLVVAANQHTAGLGRPATRFGFLGDGSEASSYNANRNGIVQAGLFDEVRITHNALSADHIETTYNNQNSPSTFFVIDTEEEQNRAPVKPTMLFANHTTAQTGLINPSDVALVTDLRFSAVHNDDDPSDIAQAAQIQVSTDPSFSSITHWDSGTSTITDLTEGDRSIDIVYDSFGAVATLPLSMDDGNVTYYWRIRFEDDGDLLGQWSDPSSFSLLDIPTAPSGIGVLKIASDEFGVTWADNSTNESGFVVERKEDSGGGFGPWTIASTTASSTTNYIDAGLALNSAFMYRVSAFNFAGTSTVVVDSATHYSDPAAPINVFGDYQTDSQFDVNWTDQAPVIMTDSVEHCVGLTDCAAETYTQIGGGLVTSTSSPLIDNISIAPNETFRWRVRADNTSATSTYTYSPYEYTTPTAPGSVVAAYVSDSIINLFWADNSQFEDGFRIWVSANGGAFTELTPGVNTVGAGVESYTFSSAMPDTSYQFEIHAHVPATTYNAELGSVATTSVVETTPEAPDNIQSTFVSDSNITVTWDDNSNNEDVFSVYAAQEGGSFTLVGTTTADVETFTYTGGAGNSFYDFYVESTLNPNPPTNPTALSASSTVGARVYTTPNTPLLSNASVSSLGADWNITDTSDYEVGFELTQSDGVTLAQDIPLADVTTAVETGLSPNTLVERRIRSYVENDGTKLYSPSSTTTSLYTLANAPFIATTTVMTVSTTSIDWAWQTESNPTYTEYFATNLTSSTTFGWSTDASWNETGLSCENSYDFEVRARNQDGVETAQATSTQSTPTCDMTITVPAESQTVASTTTMFGSCSADAVVTVTGTDLVGGVATSTCSGVGTYSLSLDFGATVGATLVSVNQTLAPFATSTTLVRNVVVDPSSGTDSDADGVSDALEDAGHNGGDGNGDGIQDSVQQNVAGVPNTITGGYTTIESSGSCSIVQDADVLAESLLPNQDDAYEYPVGLADYKLQCASVGATSTVSIYYDQEYDTSQWVLRKYASSTGLYTTVGDLVVVTPTDESISSHTLLQGPASTTQVSKINFVIQDGDALDDDTSANQEIIDPVGPAILIPTVAASSGGGGGTRFYCRDPDAINYTTRKGRQDNGLCKYETEKTEEDNRITDPLNELNNQTTVTDSVCAPYLTETIGLNRNNNAEEVNKLIDFLNEHEGESLVRDGSYDLNDFEAVKRFQLKYKTSVLDIWGLTEPTGYVYFTTRMKINSFMCNKSLSCPVFTEYNSRTNENNASAEVQRTKVFMTELGFYSGPINQNYDNAIYQSIIDFQETFSATMLKPWGLKSGTGYKYKTTNKFMNELVGCTTDDLVLENGNTVSY